MNEHTNEITNSTLATLALIEQGVANVKERLLETYREGYTGYFKDLTEVEMAGELRMIIARATLVLRNLTDE